MAPFRWPFCGPLKNAARPRTFRIGGVCLIGQKGHDNQRRLIAPPEFASRSVLSPLQSLNMQACSSAMLKSSSTSAATVPLHHSACNAHSTEAQRAFLSRSGPEQGPLPATQNDSDGGGGELSRGFVHKALQNLQSLSRACQSLESQSINLSLSNQSIFFSLPLDPSLSDCLSLYLYVSLSLPPRQNPQIMLLRLAWVTKHEMMTTVFMDLRMDLRLIMKHITAQKLPICAKNRPCPWIEEVHVEIPRMDQKHTPSILPCLRFLGAHHVRPMFPQTPSKQAFSLKLGANVRCPARFCRSKPQHIQSPLKSPLCNNCVAECLCKTCASTLEAGRRHPKWHGAEGLRHHPDDLECQPPCHAKALVVLLGYLGERLRGNTIRDNRTESL